MCVCVCVYVCMYVYICHLSTQTHEKHINHFDNFPENKPITLPSFPIWAQTKRSLLQQCKTPHQAPHTLVTPVRAVTSPHVCFREQRPVGQVCAPEDPESSLCIAVQAMFNSFRPAGLVFVCTPRTLNTTFCPDSFDRAVITLSTLT